MLYAVPPLTQEELGSVISACTWVLLLLDRSAIIYYCVLLSPLGIPISP